MGIFAARSIIMSEFIVSARKYRPDTFDTVVGQQAITSTLKSAIRKNQLAQAYLFCGPRGVGKTTCARIFAKTINCSSLSDTVEACNECESCKSFNQNRSYNIHELDAASNNSVDDIRLLIDQVRIPPQVSRYSVYIIDEVHMLSQSAFNAFLKTLEEPPKHAIFILATTEKHKILPTILSRCQIFDFNRIRVSDITEYLAGIAAKESIDYDADALNLVAQKADGAMRDALSIFDQIVSFSDGSISYRQVIENLNILDYDYYFRLTDAFLAGEVTKALLLFDEILASGFDAHNFINALARHLRDLLVCKDPKSISLLEVGDSLRERYLEQSGRCSDSFIYEALDTCSTCDLSFKASKNQRLHIELALIKLCNQGQKKNDTPVEDALILPRISEPPKPEVRTSAETSPTTVQETEKTTPVDPDPPSPVRKQAVERRSSDTPSIKDALNTLKSVTPPAETSPAGTDEPVNEEDESGEGDSDMLTDDQSESFTEDDLYRFWDKFVESIRETEPRIYTSLSKQKPLLEEDNRLVISFQNNTLVEDFKLKTKPALSAYLKRSLKNDRIELSEQVSEVENSTPTRHYTDKEKLNLLAEKNPMIKKLFQDFNLDFE